ncbi:hypothetical protein [Candidatus Enterococcus moelleringii]|uniref:hypothetical protein n=1 Tax=Candidatus Enterococcus moelleringii TaxID=2815325 RepID=UPI001F615951|nr:hypothetical protein [Enterococcus sp. 669A]
MKKKGIIILLFLVLIMTGCSKEKNFVGTWEADLLNQSARDGAGELSKEMYGGVLGSFASLLADEIHWNATMEIREDGTLTMSNGMEFTANWELDGDTIIISGKNISGTATLSDDQKTLYFKNTVSSEDSGTEDGLMVGSDSLDFEFTRKEE